MTMEWLERELRKTGIPDDRELADHVARMRRVRGKDIPLPPPQSLTSPEELLNERELAEESLIRQTMEAYHNQPHTPELVTQTWQTVWKVWAEHVDPTISVPPCDRALEELEELKKNGYMMVYVPEEVSRRENRQVLQQIFQFDVHYWIHSYMAPDEDLAAFNSVTNNFDQFGWLDIESETEDTPYHREMWFIKAKNRLENLEAKVYSQGRVGQTLNTYIIGSRFARLAFGSSFDSNSGSIDMCTILGSSLGGEPLMLADYHTMYLAKYHPHWAGGTRSARIKKVA